MAKSLEQRAEKKNDDATGRLGDEDEKMERKDEKTRGRNTEG